MKWIYGELQNVLNKPMKTYRINPDYIMAVNLNERQLVIRDFDHPLFYRKEDEPLILAIINDGE